MRVLTDYFSVFLAVDSKVDEVDTNNASYYFSMVAYSAYSLPVTFASFRL